VRTGDETKAVQDARETDAVDPGPARGGPGSGDGATSGRLVRLAVNLGPESSDVLKEYASRKGVSVTEAVRRAIAVLAFVDETQRRGASINVEEDGVLKEVMFLT
jgi:hypothetical protein